MKKLIRGFAHWLGRKHGMVSGETLEREQSIAYHAGRHSMLAIVEQKEKQFEEGKRVQLMQIDAALACLSNPEAILPDRFEIAAPADAEYANAGEFVEKVNDLKRALGELGWHVRIFSRKENVWLFRNMPRGKGSEIKALDI